MVLGDKFLGELKKRSGLSEKHILIIKSLKNGDLNAKKISQKSDIPLGRLYGYINELLKYGLIEKKGKKPCVYSLDGMDEKVRNFMKNRFDEVVRDHKVIYNMLEEKDKKDYIEITKSKEEFTYTQLKMLSASKKFYTIARFGSIPFMIYPTDYDKFLQLRKVVAKARPTLAHSAHEMSMMVNRAYADACQEGKSLSAIVCKKTFYFHLELARKELGEEFMREMLRDLRNKIRIYNLKIFLLDEYFPMQVFFNEDSAYLSLIHEGASIGTMIHSRDVKDIYKEMYKGMLNRSEPVEKHIKSILNGSYNY